MLGWQRISRRAAVGVETGVRATLDERNRTVGAIELRLTELQAAHEQQRQGVSRRSASATRQSRLLRRSSARCRHNS